MEKIKSIIEASIKTKQQILQNNELIATIEKVVEVVTNAFKNGNRVVYGG